MTRVDLPPPETPVTSRPVVLEPSAMDEDFERLFVPELTRESVPLLIVVLPV